MDHRAPGVACREPGCEEGDDYPLIMLPPTAAGIRVSGFRAETAGEYLEGGLAVLPRRFRAGPPADRGATHHLRERSRGLDSMCPFIRRSRRASDSCFGHSARDDAGAQRALRQTVPRSSCRRRH